jgi:hypothetical protein
MTRLDVFLLETSDYGLFVPSRREAASPTWHSPETFEGQRLNSRDQAFFIISIGAEIMIPKEWQSFTISSLFRSL